MFLDVDPALFVPTGHDVDDDLALLFALALESPGKVRLRGVSITAGNAALAHTAAVPELWCNFAPLRVNGINDRLPARQALLTMKIRHVRIAVGCYVIWAGAFRNNEPHTPRRTPPVIRRRGLAGDVVRRMVTGHGGHDDTVLGAQRFEREGIK